MTHFDTTYIVPHFDFLKSTEYMTGKFQVRAENLLPLYNQVKILENCFNNVSYQHIRREFNKEADALANRALDEK